MAHCVGCATLRSESDAAGRGLAKLSRSASTRCAFSIHPASATPCASIRRLRSPTGRPASASAPARAPGAPRQQGKRGGARSPTLRIPGRECPAGSRVEGVRGGGSGVGGGTAGGVERGGWHRVAVPRSGPSARPRRLRRRDRAKSRPMRSRSTPIGCREESPRLPADGILEVGQGRGGWHFRGGGSDTGLKMTKQVLATRELRKHRGLGGGGDIQASAVRARQYLCLQSHPALRVGRRAQSITGTRWGRAGRGSDSPASAPCQERRSARPSPATSHASGEGGGIQRTRSANRTTQKYYACPSALLWEDLPS